VKLNEKMLIARVEKLPLTIKSSELNNFE